MTEDYASSYSQPKETALNGNYWGLNGLGLGDAISRSSNQPKQGDSESPAHDPPNKFF
jgi:hypothetical protein